MGQSTDIDFSTIAQTHCLYALELSAPAVHVHLVTKRIERCVAVDEGCHQSGASELKGNVIEADVTGEGKRVLPGICSDGGGTPVAGVGPLELTFTTEVCPKATADPGRGGGRGIIDDGVCTIAAAKQVPVIASRALEDITALTAYQHIFIGGTLEDVTRACSTYQIARGYAQCRSCTDADQTIVH